MEETQSQSMASTTAAIKSMDPPATPPAQQVASATLLVKVEALIAKADAIIGSDVLNAKGYIEKYWPIAAGVLIAATRLL